MSTEISVIVYRVGAKPVIEAHVDTLESWQAIVGGDIEYVALSDSLALICNEEGKIANLPYNRTAEGVDDIMGNFFVCRTADGDFTSVEPSDLEEVKSLIF